jgi:hypothetical protein
MKSGEFVIFNHTIMYIRYILIFLLSSLQIFSQTKAVETSSVPGLGDKKNPMYGMVYSDHSKVVQFKNYLYQGGSVIGEKNKTGAYDFSFNLLSCQNRNIIVLSKTIGYKNQKDGSMMPLQKILDTVNIHHIKPDEEIVFFQCCQDTTLRPGLIALAIKEKKNKAHLDRIIMAWMCDTKSGNIIPLNEVKGINCMNEEYESTGEENPPSLDPKK